MSKLRPEAPLIRETAATYRGREIMVTLTPRCLRLRLKRQRHEVTVTWETVLELGYRLLAREALAEKRKVKRQSTTRRAAPAASAKDYPCSDAGYEDALELGYRLLAREALAEKKKVRKP